MCQSTRCRARGLHEPSESICSNLGTNHESRRLFRSCCYHPLHFCPRCNRKFVADLLSDFTESFIFIVLSYYYIFNLPCFLPLLQMSTTDSILISISQIITSDIIYPMRPQATPKQVNWFGRAVSFVVAAFSLVLALTWKGSIIKLYEVGAPSFNLS